MVTTAVESIFTQLWYEYGSEILAEDVPAPGAMQGYFVQWHKLIANHFDEEELKTLCFELEIDYEDLPARGKSNKARELVTRILRAGRLSDLVTRFEKARPHISLPPVPGDVAQPPPAWIQTTAYQYASTIKKEYGTTRMLGQSKPLSLDGIYTNVYVLDKPTALRRFDMAALQEQFTRGRQGEKGAHQSGDEIVKKRERLFILGKPGAGKTTFLKHIAQEAIQGKLDRVPVFVSLKALADAKQTLLEFIMQQFERCGLSTAFVTVLLRAGKAIVLLDGLDEVNKEGEERDTLITGLNAFMQTYPHCQFLITCRIAATDYSFDTFTYVEMADFTLAQIQAFATNWFDRETGKLFLTELTKPENKGLRELAQVPLLLSLLCVAFTETLTFPQRRTEIYEEALDALLKKWDTSRRIRRDEVYHKLSLGRKRQLLAWVAYKTFAANMYFIEQNALKAEIEAYLADVPAMDGDGEIDGEVVLKAIEAQHGIFVERSRQIYSFSHLTLQEYFTAKYIVNNEARGTLAKLMRHITDKRWREVFLLTASQLDDATDFCQLFVTRLRGLIAEDKVLRELLTWASRKATEAKAAYTAPAVRSFYIFLALNIDLSLKRGRDYFLERAIGKAEYKARELSQDFGLGQLRAIDFVADGAYELALDRSFDLSLALDLTFGRPGVDVKHMAESMERLLTISSRLNDLSCYQALEELPVLNESSSNQVIDNFFRQLYQLVMEHRNIGHVWGLTLEQARLFSDYLEANRLFVACMKLAYIPSQVREEIESQLLLPPVAGEG